MEKTDKRKTSWYLPEHLLEAMSIVSQEEGVLKSHQIEMGLKLYLEKHKELLTKRDIEIWQEV